MVQKFNVCTLLLLIFAFLVYSTTGIFSKLTSEEEFMSGQYVMLLSLVIVAMGVYAVLWQIILKKVPLSQAFLFKSMTVIFALCFAHFLFDETITLQNMLGAAFIVAGIIVNSQSISAQ